MGGRIEVERWDRGEQPHSLQREESEAGQRRLQELLQETLQEEVRTSRNQFVHLNDLIRAALTEGWQTNTFKSVWDGVKKKTKQKTTLTCQWSHKEMVCISLNQTLWKILPLWHDKSNWTMVFFLLTGVVMRRKRREARKRQKTKTAVSMRHRGKIPNWHIWRWIVAQLCEGHSHTNTDGPSGSNVACLSTQTVV